VRLREAARACRPYLALVGLSFPLWYAGVLLLGGQGLFDHSPIDQHTRQASAWLGGRIDLPEAPRYLEIADYQGRFFVSFPPVPSLVELPLVLLWGGKTPNALFGIYLFWALALAAQYTLLRRRAFDESSAVLASLAFVFATNLYPTCVRANVWAYGQSLGYCLAVIGLVFVLQNRGGGHGVGYLLLALAVGCRPLLALLFPLFLALDHRTTPRSLGACLRSLLLWAGPVALALAAYNLARFGTPLEFGHNHLPWARALPRGIFSLSSLPANAYHAFLCLPTRNREWPYIRFDTLGTAFWLNNAIVVVAVWGLTRRPLDPWIRVAATFALLAIGVGVLSYEGGGARQFGFRFVLDVAPAAFVAFAFAYKRFSGTMLAVAIFSVLVNVYGLAIWKKMPQGRRSDRGVGAGVSEDRAGFIARRWIGEPFLSSAPSASPSCPFGCSRRRRVRRVPSPRARSLH